MKKGKGKGKGKVKKTNEVDKETLARMKVEDHKKWYKLTWGTPVGQDCIYLNKSLAAWLGERLAFFGEHTNNFPMHYELYESWQDDLRKHEQALLHYAKQVDEGEIDVDTDEARQALEYVALNFRHLAD
jgi:hypothetical protein